MYRSRYLYLSAAAVLVAVAIAAPAQAAQPLKRGLGDFRLSSGQLTLAKSQAGDSAVLRRGVTDFGLSVGQVAPVRQAGKAPILKRGLGDFGTLDEHAPATGSRTQYVGSPVDLAAQGGFDWGDAGAEAGFGFAVAIIVLLGAGLAIAGYRRRHMGPV